MADSSSNEAEGAKGKTTMQAVVQLPKPSLPRVHQRLAAEAGLLGAHLNVALSFMRFSPSIRTATVDRIEKDEPRSGLMEQTPRIEALFQWVQYIPYGRLLRACSVLDRESSRKGMQSVAFGGASSECSDMKSTIAAIEMQKSMVLSWPD